MIVSIADMVFVVLAQDVDNGETHVLPSFHIFENALAWLHEEVENELKSGRDHGDNGGFEEWKDECGDDVLTYDDYISSQLQEYDDRVDEWLMAREKPVPKGFKKQQELKAQQKGFEWGIFMYKIVKTDLL